MRYTFYEIKVELQDGTKFVELCKTRGTKKVTIEFFKEVYPCKSITWRKLQVNSCMCEMRSVKL